MSQLKVDTITDEAGTGSPNFPNGITGVGLAEANWEAGTSTTESIVSPAKVKAAIEALVPAPSGPTTQQVLDAMAGASAGAVGTYTSAYYEVTGTLTTNRGSSISSGTVIAGSSLRVGVDLNEANSFGAIGSKTPFIQLGSGGPSFPTGGTTTLAGSWRLITSGKYRERDADGYYSYFAHLWLRIS